MSKTNLRRPQKKTTLKKRQDWDSSIGDLSQHRLSDDETNRRKQAYQSRNLTLIQEEKQRKLLAKAVHDARKNNSNQLGILREILFNERDVDELMQRSNQVLQSSRGEKFVPKSSILRSGKNHFTSLTDNRTRKTSSSSVTSRRPSSIRNLNSPGGADWNQSEEDNNASASSDDDRDDDELENEPVRLNRASRKSDSHAHESSTVHVLNDREQSQSTNRHSQGYTTVSRPATANNGPRSMNNVSFLSDVSKPMTKTNGSETTTAAASSIQLKSLLDRLSSELNELEGITGYKAEKTDSSSNTCSTALITALINLAGHVKQSALSTKGHGNSDTNTLKDQLSVVIKAQLDFQQKVESQISMLQTMMQTVCQLVNNEIIANKKSPPSQPQPQPQLQPTSNNMNQSVRLRREQPDYQSAETRMSSIPRQTLLPRSNQIDEPQQLTSRINTATPIEIHSHRTSIYDDIPDPSKRLSRPVSSLSTNESNTYELTKSMAPRRNLDQDSRLTNISPIDVPSSYDLFESGLPKTNSNMNMLRSGLSRPTSATTNAAVPTNETILEKILQERLLLVQQIAELNKQHELTQEELANLEANALHQRAS